MRSHHSPGLLDDHQTDALLDDIELSCRSELANARSLATSTRRVSVVVSPGNVVDRAGHGLAAETVELTSGAATCRAGAPVAVGSVFHLAFDRSALDLAPTLAVCDRCTMLGDDAFEARFRFVQNLVLPS